MEVTRKAVPSQSWTLIIQAPHCFKLSRKICLSTSCVPVESQIQQVFTEHLSHGRMHCMCFIKSTIWDRYYYTHSIQDKNRGSENLRDLQKTHRHHRAAVQPHSLNFKPRTLLIIKFYKFPISQRLLLHHPTVPGSTLGTKILCWMTLTFALHSCFWASKQSHIHVWLKTINLRWFSYAENSRMQLYLRRDWEKNFNRYYETIINIMHSHAFLFKELKCRVKSQEDENSLFLKKLGPRAKKWHAAKASEVSFLVQNHTLFSFVRFILKLVVR